MSYRFDKSEVPQFEPDSTHGPCVACNEHESSGRTDRHTGLCRSCRRVVILGPAMRNREVEH